ncbi:VOC family protein [Nocardia jinanensis]|uniref:VOC family protein n=1 Tax=Nocardia jinanensis TaxID=382504 RepID=UPI0035714349
MAVAAVAVVRQRSRRGALIAESERRPVTGAHGTLICTTESVDETFARLRDAGVRVTQEPIDQVYDVRDCGFADPGGGGGISCVSPSRWAEGLARGVTCADSGSSRRPAHTGSPGPCASSQLPARWPSILSDHGRCADRCRKRRDPAATRGYPVPRWRTR